MTEGEQKPILVLGCGAWGTSLAMVLRAAGRPVTVWGYETDYVAEIERTRRNPKFLPGVDIPAGIRFVSTLDDETVQIDTVFSVIPTQFLRSGVTSLRQRLPSHAVYVSCSKGFEEKTLKRPSELLQEFFPNSAVVVLSGPSHAEEVSRQLPAALVAGCSDLKQSVTVQQLVGGPRLRVYTSADPIGVEVGGATKNVMAIASGISDGLGFGDNARAALMTRGLSELTRLGCALGGQRATFSGLSGIGDLAVTCASQHSRNWNVGNRIGRGERLVDIVSGTDQVAEGVATTRSLHELQKRLKLDLPITSEVHAVLFEGKTPREAVEALMSREFKHEEA